MLVKVHERLGRKVMALCDSRLIGEVLREGEIEIDLKEKHRSFYEGQSMSFEEIRKMMSECVAVNAIGKEAYKILVELEIVPEDFKPLMIGGEPHVQVYFI